MKDKLELLTGLGGVIDRYSTLFVDVWGVLHDGETAFPGAGGTLVRARQRGTKVVLITNSAAGFASIADCLGDLGIRADAYDHIVTSGELTRRHLLARGAVEAWLPVVIVRQGRGPSWLATLPHPVVERVEDAGMIVVASIPYRTEAELQESGLDALIDFGCGRGLPMVCADPDETYPENGVVRLGPGWLARLYREAGGEVIEFGKPHAPVYEEALRLAGGPSPEEVLVIGDNLSTDIVGAAKQGFDSLLVQEGGVHEGATAADLQSLADHFGATPTYVVPRLAW
jgi:HAD superfamily hydrolase (TIGR01459 family)